MVAQGIAEIFYYLGFVAVSTFGLLIVLFLILSPRDPRPTPEKRAPFESGQIAVGRGRTRFIVQYYPYLLMFVVYDVVAMFLFAWALNFRSIEAAVGFSGTLPVVIFLVVLMIPLAYALHLSKRPENW